MAGRRQAREIAFQMLYQQDLNPGLSPQAVRDMISSRLQAASLRDFAWTLFAGTTDVLTNLDQQIEAVARNWSLKRMAPTDRNILRLGAYELLHTDTPHEVVIDEAIELAKRFSAAQSPQFVNGILDRLIPDKQETNTASGQAC